MQGDCGAMGGEMILVKRWKETTATCRLTNVTVDDDTLYILANTIMDGLPQHKPGDLYKERPNAVWAQVEVRCSIKVLEELKTALPRPDDIT